MNNEYEDDSDLTEITIQPDGRVYAYGVSEKILEVLRLLEQEQGGDARPLVAPCGSGVVTSLLHVET